MIILPEKITVFFDVDSTLVLWDATQEEMAIKGIKFGEGDYAVMCVPHEKHIEMLRQHKARNHLIVVWSAGGVSWAEAVIKKLGLEDLVDLVVTKPHFFYDDLPSSMFMPESSRVYKDPIHGK